MDKRLLRPEEAAHVLGISRSKVYELIRAGRLRAVKLDRSRRIPGEAVDELIAMLTKEAAA